MTVSSRLHTLNRRKTIGMKMSFTSTFCTVLAMDEVKMALLDRTYIAGVCMWWVSVGRVERKTQKHVIHMCTQVV